MDMQQLFETWAPPDSVWSRWAKPALFAETAASATVIPGSAPGLPEPPPPPSSPREETRMRVLEDSSTAFILDLPGAQSVELGLALARAGYQPVPLFNTADHPAAVVSVRPVLDQLKAGAEEVRGLGTSPGAPPAFLLDSGRRAGAPGPGRFDNRWIVFPQDFPSATFLLSQGIHRVVLLQPRTPADQPQEDLAHVLRRWQEAGVEIYLQDPSVDEPPRPLTVQRPSSFRNLAYRAFALFGLKRNSAGGFGSIIPVVAAGGGGGFG